MRQMSPPRRDPAPSRLSYRLQRLWLTPLVRRLVRVGLPVSLTVLGVGWYLADQERRDALGLAVADMRRSVEERPEFMLREMQISGASRELTQDIREVLMIDFPASSFDLELPVLHAAVAGLDAVAGAEVQVRPGGILQISVTERLSAVIWRGREGLELLDATGHRVAPLAARALRPDLPLIVGDGAEAHVVEALALLRAAQPLQGRVRALVRMGERRWDLVLDRDMRILLPEDRPGAALNRAIALHQAEDLLERDIRAVDLRNEDRPTVRMAPAAVQELRRVRAYERGEATE